MSPVPEDDDEVEQPEIPAIPGALADPIHALTRAALLFRTVFGQLEEGTSLPEIFAAHGPHLLMAERVIDTWCRHLGIDPEEEDPVN
jgi:hypothetical protein